MAKNNSMSHNWHFRLYLAYALSILLVLMTCFALLLLRGLISQLEDNPEWLTDFLSEQLNAKVQLGKLEIGSLGNTILISIDELAIRDSDSEVPVLNSDKIEARINVLKSALSFSLVTTKIKLQSPFVALTHHVDGSLSLGGAGFKRRKGESWVNRWLFKQKRVQMTNLELNIYSERFFKNWKIINADLKVMPAGKFTRLKLDSKMPDNGVLDARMQWQGNLAQDKGWDGRAYIKGNNLPAYLFLALAPNEFVRINQAKADVLGQFKWQKGQMQIGFGKLEFKNLVLNNLQTGESFKTENIKTDFLINTINDKTHARLNLTLPGTESLDPVPMVLNAIYTEDKLDLVLFDLDLKLVDYFASLTLNKKTQELLTGIDPKGWIERLQISLPKAKRQKFKARIKFSDLKLTQAANIPGIKDLYGSIDIYGDNIKVNLNSNGLLIDIPRGHFRKPIWLGKLNAEVYIAYKDKANWIIAADKFLAQTHDAHASAAFRIKPIKGQLAPFLELVGNFNANSLRRVSDYLPVKILKPKLINWLDKAFSKGIVSNGKVLIHGDTKKHVPLNAKKRRQLISMDIADVNLHYHKDWPDARATRGHLVFSQESLKANILSATSKGATASNLNATIADFREKPAPVMNLRLSTADLFNNLKNFVQESPLKPKFAGFLQNASISGNPVLDLNLLLPLKKTDALKPGFNGKLKLIDNSLYINPVALKLDSLRGELKFSESGLSADEIKGRVLGGEFSAKIDTPRPFNQADGQIKIKVEGGLQGKKLKSWAKFILPDINGNSDWQGEINFNKSGANNINLSSDLKGARVFMPDIIDKPVTRSLKTTLNIDWNKSGSTKLKFSAANFANGELGKHKNSSWYGGIRLLRGKLILSKSGIKIAADLPFLNVDGWTNWLGTKTSGSMPSQRVFLSGDIKKLLVGDTAYRSVRVDGSYLKQKLNVNFKSGSLSGNLQLGKEGALRLNLDRFVIGKSNSLSNPSKRTKNQRPISLEIKSLIFAGKDLGKFKVNLNPGRNGTSISNLSLSSSSFKLTGSGNWHQSGNSCTLKVKINAPRLQNLLGLFGYSGYINKAGTLVNLDANWSGKPGGFAVNKLNGTGKLTISEGEFKDAPKSGGGLINLLRLNLSAVNKQGLDFRNISGNFKIRRGVVSTDKIILNASAADIVFAGSASLPQKTFNLRTIITPKISSTLPLVGAVTAGVPGLIIGGALNALNKLSGDKLNKAVRRKLKISGPWSKPKVTDLKTNRAQVKQDENTDLIGLPSNE